MDKIIVNRLEVIDHTTTFGGRTYVKWVNFNFTVELSEQDGGRTLKIFLKDAPDSLDSNIHTEEIHKSA